MKDSAVLELIGELAVDIVLYIDSELNAESEHAKIWILAQALKQGFNHFDDFTSFKLSLAKSLSSGDVQDNEQKKTTPTIST